MLRSSIVERALILAGTAITCACASAAQLPVSAGFGAQPTLPPPDKSAIPLVKVATARGWPDGQKPVAAEGTTVTAFAQGLQHPRWLYVLPNGDVLVAETNGPERPEDNKGIKEKSSSITTRRQAAPFRARTASRCYGTLMGWSCRNTVDLCIGVEFAVRHGACRRRAVRRRF
jgi:glucose/arabinose dehydrogenase